jgi:hypothetical protein
MKYPEIWDEKHYKFSSWGDMKGVKLVPDRKPWAEYIFGGGCFALIMILLMFIN